jgi:hypothetical protein
MGELLVVVAVLMGAWIAWRVWRSRRRAQALTVLGTVRRQARAVSIRVRAQPHALPLLRGRVTREVGDMALGEERFLLVGDRGILLDLGPGRGRPLESARCPVHGLLILEGANPLPDGPASFRLELSLPDAADWAEDLQPFVDAPPGAPRYVIRPPW